MVNHGEGSFGGLLKRGQATFLMVDLYCERLGPGLWAEPLNALSNLAFFVSAWAAWRSARARETTSPSVELLIGMVAAIGLGSLLFHTFATNWARFLDVTPILIFQLLFFWIYSRQIAVIGSGFTLSLCVAFVLGIYVCAQYPYLLNGSLGYLPALAVLLVLGFYHRMKEKRERNLLMTASGVFLLSLVFRTIDNGICSFFTPGTHFLWHLLNSLVLYLLLRGIIMNLTPWKT